MKKIKIEVVSAPGCSKCSIAGKVVEKLVSKRKDVVVKEINIAENPDYAIKYRIMSTPAIIINGKLEFNNIPKEEELKRKLNEISDKK